MGAIAFSKSRLLNSRSSRTPLQEGKIRSECVYMCKEKNTKEKHKNLREVLYQWLVSW